jgi:hypothetical protein
MHQQIGLHVKHRQIAHPPLAFIMHTVGHATATRTDQYTIRIGNQLNPDTSPTILRLSDSTQTMIFPTAKRRRKLRLCQRQPPIFLLLGNNKMNRVGVGFQYVIVPADPG